MPQFFPQAFPRLLRCSGDSREYVLCFSPLGVLYACEEAIQKQLSNATPASIAHVQPILITTSADSTRTTRVTPSLVELANKC